MKQKNILFISSWYPNQEDPTLGVFVRRHALAASKHNNVKVLFTKSDEEISEIKIEEINCNGIQEIIISYPKVKTSIPVLGTYLKVKKLLKSYDIGLNLLIEKEFHPEIIHCNVMDPVGIVALNWKKKRNIPYVVTEHWTGYTDLDGRYAQSRKLKSYIPTIANNASWILPVSTDLEKALIEKGLGEKHKVIRNVVDTDSFVFSPVSPMQFLVVADLENDQKNISGIVQAFDVFSKSNPTIQLTIAGGGKNEVEIRSEITRLNLEGKVKLIGRVSADVLSDNLNKSYGLLLFSNYENLPCVIIESFACGIPVISTDVGGISEIINAENGILIQPKNKLQLVEAMNITLEKKWDQKAIRQFAINNFSLDKIGKEFDSVYQSI